MAGITIRDANGNVILSESDYYLRKIETKIVAATGLKTFINYSGMSHTSHLVKVRQPNTLAGWNYTVVAVSDGGFWLYSQSAEQTKNGTGKDTNFTVDIYRRN